MRNEAELRDYNELQTEFYRSVYQGAVGDIALFKRLAKIYANHKEAIHHHISLIRQIVVR